MSIVKFSGPKDKIKLNFHNLPTPMVEWEGTAKELHDLLMKAWYESEPEVKAALKVEELAAIIYERAFDCQFKDCDGAERALWLAVAEKALLALRPYVATPASTGEANGWVSVANPPEISGMYLVYPPDSCENLGIPFSTRYFEANENGVYRRQGWSKHPSHSITHWQPLPPAPTSVPQAEPPKHKHEGFPLHITRSGEGIWDKNCPDCEAALNRAAQAEPKGETK